MILRAATFDKEQLRELLRCSILVAGEELAVAFVAAGVETSVGNGVLHRAAGLVGVRAVGKFTAAHVWPQVAHPAADFFRHHVPKLKLSDAGCVDHVAAGRERNQFRGGRRVPAFL